MLSASLMLGPLTASYGSSFFSFLVFMARMLHAWARKGRKKLSPYLSVYMDSLALS